MKHIFIIFFLSIFFLSCTNKKEDKTAINLDNLTQASISDFVDSIDVVQLETREDCLISMIDKVVFSKGRYYVLDVRQQCLLCFDSSGRFLFKIDKRGQGPDEYSYLEDFNIDSYNNRLLLLEPFGHLLTFDLDGRFISKVRLPLEIGAYNEVFPLDNDSLVFISINEYSVIFYSKSKNEVTDKLYKIDDARGALFMPSNKTYTYDNKIFFNPPLTNDIVSLSDSTIFTWNFGEKNNSVKQIDQLKKRLKSKSKMERSDYVGEGVLNYSMEYNYESSKYRICILHYGNFQFRHIFFDKTTEKSFVFDKTTENILLLLPDFCGESIIMYDHGIKENPFIDFKYYDINLLNETQKNIINSHNPGVDNPFIIVYHLKR